MNSINIANQALSEAGARSTILSFAENSPEAAKVNLFFGPVRDQALRAARWNFSRRTALLTLLKAAPGTPENTSSATAWDATQPPPGWRYSYAYPSDCIAFWGLRCQPSAPLSGVPIFPVGEILPPMGGHQMRPAHFQIASDDDANGNPVNVVLCNESQAIAIYGREIADPHRWDTLFREAVVQALAGKLAMALTGKADVAKMRIQTANNAIMAARAADANEHITTTDRDADWINARTPMASYTNIAAWADYGPLFSPI